jgi:hypothetical protein
MSGQASLRGYLVQTIIAILESLENNDWKSVCIEPNDEHEKVDIKWIYENDKKTVCQVKSSQNSISYSDADKWVKDLKSSTNDAQSYTLFLVGRLTDNLYKKVNTFEIIIKYKELNMSSLNAEMLQLIDKFYSKKGKDKITYDIKDILANSLVTDFIKSSIVGQVILREEFDNKLLNWICAIEKMALQNPFAQFIPEQIQQPINKNHEIIKSILKLIGWENLSEFESLQEINEETGEELNYSVDFYQKQESRLKDNVEDNIYVSNIIDNEYSDDCKKQLQNYLISTNKIIDKHNNKGITSDKEKSIFSILFWLSLNNKDVNTDFNDIVKHYFKSPDLESNTTYLFVDNARTNFLINSIITAKNFNNFPVKFLYPITEENLSPKKIGKRGLRLPPQYINSSIIPIIKENEEKISILLFCNDSYSAENLKKVIWLIVKLTSGFGNEYVIYFPDYDGSHTNEINEILSSFNDEFLSKKICVKTMSITNYTEIGNLPHIENNIVKNEEYDENTEKQSVHINEVFLGKLPYGDILKPFLKSDLIMSNDLKIFLSHRGIFFKNSDKVKITKLMISLLFTPNELENFVRFINKKERPAPSAQVLFSTIERTPVSEIIEKTRPDFSKVTDEIQSRLLDEIEFKPDKINPAIYIYESYVEVKDPTKQIAINTQCFPIKITCKREDDNTIVINVETNCRDGKTIGKRIVKVIENILLANNISKNESIKIMFNSFKNNIERVNFLLSFTRIDDSDIFIDNDIKSIKYNFDASQQIPDNYKDKTDKDIIFILRGKRLSSINEISEDDFKRSIFLEEIEVNYKFSFLGIIGYYSVLYNFSNALKPKNSMNGEFRTKPYLHETYRIKKNVKDSKSLERGLRNEFERIKLNRFKTFNLI